MAGAVRLSVGVIHTMLEKEAVISLGELTKIEVFCTACGSGAVFAFNKDVVLGSDMARYGTNSQTQSCPSCSTHFGSSILGALNKWHQLVAFAQGDTKFHLKFHVSQSGTF